MIDIYRGKCEQQRLEIRLRTIEEKIDVLSDQIKGIKEMKNDN